MAQETRMGSINLDGCDGQEMRRRFKRKGIYVYLFMLRFDRKQQNSVKQLSFNEKNTLKKKDWGTQWKEEGICGNMGQERD